MSSVHVLVRTPRSGALWNAGRWAAIIAVPALLLWLVMSPRDALRALWYVVVPVLPATFFLDTAIWRGICPLATLNEWGNRLGHQRPLTPRAAAYASVIGLVLFAVLVPARRFLFNQDGLTLAVTVLAVGAIAVALGSVYAVRSAFCNGLCPVLPVELLYGQAPLLGMQRGRCTSCTVCTPRGCLDLSHGKAFSQAIGTSRRSTAWLGTPFGVFVAALPGFVIGYGELADGALVTAPRVYGTTLGAALVSWVIVAAAVRGLRIPSGVAHPLLAGLAGGAYYWYAGPAIAAELGLPDLVSLAVRVLGIGLVTYWLWRQRRSLAQR